VAGTADELAYLRSRFPGADLLWKPLAEGNEGLHHAARAQAILALIDKPKR